MVLVQRFLFKIILKKKKEKGNKMIRLTWYRLSSCRSSKLCCREATARHCTALALLCGAQRITAL